MTTSLNLVLLENLDVEFANIQLLSLSPEYLKTKARLLSIDADHAFPDLEDILSIKI
jgi:hypothetical protein